MPVSPIYIPGRSRTACSPSSTVMELAVYSFLPIALRSSASFSLSSFSLSSFSLLSLVIFFVAIFWFFPSSIFRGSCNYLFTQSESGEHEYQRRVEPCDTDRAAAVFHL